MHLPRLRDLREGHDIIQTQIVAVLGIDQRVCGIYEAGKRDIPLPHLVTLADHYKVLTDYLLGRERS